MIKAVIFDLDGVLVDADKLHFDALNLALEMQGLDPISWQEHLTIYKAIPTIRWGQTELGFNDDLVRWVKPVREAILKRYENHEHLLPYINH